MLLTRWSIEDLELRKLREMGDIEGPNSGDRLRLLRSSDGWLGQAGSFFDYKAHDYKFATIRSFRFQLSSLSQYDDTRI